jgi:pyridoxine/pyridoxamine 5'-phosphate oxidase
MVLLTGFDARGFVFYANHGSRRARAMAEHAYVCACFWWRELERQVRIEGGVEKLAADEFDACFETRPRAARRATFTLALLNGRHASRGRRQKNQQTTPGKRLTTAN